MKNTIGAFEAKTHFSQLIKRVSSGEEIFITKRGQAVAKIIPIDKGSNNIVTKSAVERIKLLAQKMQLGKFDWEEWKAYRDNERR